MDELFEGITEKERERLLKKLEANTISFQKNNRILSYVMEDSFLGIVVDGYLQIIKEDYDGNKVIIENVVTNSLFGSMFIPFSNNEYSIFTKEDSKVILFDFEELTNNNLNTSFKQNEYHVFLRNLLKIMSKEIFSKNERIDILSNKTIRDRLLSYFKKESKKVGSKTIYLPFSFTDFAEYLAIDRSAMNRELKHLKEEKLIEVKGRRIKLLYYVNE